MKLGDAQKFVKICLSLEEFLSAAFLKFGVPAVPENVKVFDESGTEVDDDVFEDVVIEPSVGVLTIKHGADLDSASPQASHGESNLSLSSSIDSSDIQDTVIIEQSSSRKRMRLDDEAKKRIINEYNRTKSLGDETRWKMVNILAADMTEKNGIIFIYHSKAVLKWFVNQDKERLLKREQDFVLMFGEGVSGKLLEKWTTAFKRKVIQQCKKLPSTSDLEELLLAAESPTGDSEEGVNFGWDSDLSSIILLLHLIPPSAQGQKRPGKVSASQAEKHLVVFKKPYLLAVGPQKNSVHQYLIVLDQHAIPCKSTSSLGALDELFKAHFVFGTSYNIMLHNMYTFIQTTVYNIDVGKVKESPRVSEVRARLLS
ncbi:hypothetical protein Q7C36_012537 [Tachysurus vachellii]|uniref:Uncharacterized protein n=1 Tax=Tachysurus vachellii TaxID=175792 RepID=A0AA88MMM0_TACVA|nr:hypothetical protein Q7C36_012537 [Tachysurus vachellii]